MSNNPSETKVVFGLDYDNFKLATPDYEDGDLIWFQRCEICREEFPNDEITFVVYRGIEVPCCGFCKNEVLNGNIK